MNILCSLGTKRLQNNRRPRFRRIFIRREQEFSPTETPGVLETPGVFAVSTENQVCSKNSVHEFGLCDKYHYRIDL